MPITIGNTPSPSLQPEPQLDPELNNTELNDARAQLHEKQLAAKKDTKSAPRTQVGEQGTSKGTTALQSKDVLQASDPAQLLALLQDVPSSQTGNAKDLPTQKNEAAQKAFADVRPLLGKPTGERVGEQFEHKEIGEQAAKPGPLSKDSLKLALLLQTAKGGAGQPPVQLRDLASTLALTARNTATLDAGAKLKLVNAEYQRLQALAEKVLGALTNPVQPQMPPTIAKLIEQARPAIEAAVKSWMLVADKTAPDHEIVIPDAEVIALEQALQTPVETVAAANAQLAQPAAQESAANAGVSANLLQAAQHLAAEMTEFDVDTTNIESAIFFVMASCTRTQQKILRNKVGDIQTRNEDAKITRADLGKLRQEKADVEKAMRAEFDYLQSTGAIDKTVPFEQYQTWRDVTFTRGNEIALTQPLPAIPEAMTFPNGVPPEVPPGSTGMSPYNCTAEQAQAWADKYGITPQQAAYLNSYMMWVVEGGGSEQFGDPIPTTMEAFCIRLGITSPDQGNNGAMADFTLNTTLKRDKVLMPLGEDVCTGERFTELNDMGEDELCGKLFDALGGEPFTSDPKLQELLGKDAQWLRGLFEMTGFKGGDPFAIMDYMKANRKKLEEMCERLLAVQPQGEAAAMMVILCGRNDRNPKAFPGGATAFAQSLGADRTTTWGNGADLCSPDQANAFIQQIDTSFLEDAAAIAAGVVGGAVAGAATAGAAGAAGAAAAGGAAAAMMGEGRDGLCAAITRWLKEPPFNSNQAVKDALSSILGMEERDYGNKNMTDALYSFLVGPNDAEFDDDDYKDLMTNLVSAVAAAAPGSKLLMALLAFEKVDADLEDFGDQGVPNAGDLNAVYRDAKGVREAWLEEDKAAATPEEGSGPTIGEGIAGAYATEAAGVADAVKQAAINKANNKSKREAAARAAGELKGEDLGKEPGARNGKLSDIELMLQKLQDSLDTGQDMSAELQQEMSMLVDINSKLFEALSNMMSKMAKTHDQISGNQGK